VSVIERGDELDAARALVAEHGLTPDAVARLTPLVGDLPLESLGPVKQLLKQFFSDAPWTAADDDALAALFGSGAGTGTRGGRDELAPGLTLVWGWVDDQFRLRVGRDAAGDTDLSQTFTGAVVPEATPSPRTIRFATPPLHSGPARVYESAEVASDDPKVAELFGAFDEITNVLVGPDFVAVTIARPDRWEELLAPMLRAMTDRFTGTNPTAAEAATEAPVTMTLRVGADDDPAHEPRRLERAWAELGALRAERAEDRDRILAASRDDAPARRQVAAALVADAPPEVAARTWERLLADPSRSVRRSVVDAIGDAGREELRPLLERALADGDAWVRWKALHGIAALGVGPSRALVEGCAADTDFRVRLEAARALSHDS
jgi:HEAT repeats/Scaffold protein Nfu/NifU N terminal